MSITDNDWETWERQFVRQARPVNWGLIIMLLLSLSVWAGIVLAIVAAWKLAR